MRKQITNATYVFSLAAMARIVLPEGKEAAVAAPRYESIAIERWKKRIFKDL